MLNKIRSALFHFVFVRMVATPQIKRMLGTRNYYIVQLPDKPVQLLTGDNPEVLENLPYDFSAAYAQMFTIHESWSSNRDNIAIISRIIVPSTNEGKLPLPYEYIVKYNGIEVAKPYRALQKLFGAVATAYMTRQEQIR